MAKEKACPYCNQPMQPGMEDSQYVYFRCRNKACAESKDKEFLERKEVNR
jgi:hypothetical protein